MDAQTQAFQALKPICVALGDAAKALGEGAGKATAVEGHLGKLKRALSSVTANSGALHPKLTEYVFFPISQVLRVSQKATIQSLELCMQCISVLIDHGWRHQLPAQTAAQLVILCTLLADKKPQGLPFTETTEELQASAFWCLFHIFTAAGENKDTKQLLTTEAHFPQLGKTISVILDAVEDSGRGVSQAAAVAALEALLTNVADQEVHASFLPGTVSKITKTLVPSTKGRTSPQVLVRCLGILQVLLKSTLERQAGSKSLKSDLPSNGVRTASIIDEAWQKNAATQLKPALASIMVLRSHSNYEVKGSLGSLCLTILRACARTLANCSTIALETLVMICAGDKNGRLCIEFEMLLRADASIGSSLQELLYEWIRSLSTLMQGADEQAKLQRMDQIRSSYELLVQISADTSGIDRILATALRDSVVIILTLPGAPSQGAVLSSPLQSMDMAVLGEMQHLTEFDSALVKYKGQQHILQAIEGFLGNLVEHSISSEFCNGIARSLRQTEGEAQIANFWLLLRVNEREHERQSGGLAFLDFQDEDSHSSSEELEELYSFALAVLTRPTDEPTDPRLQALALRALALRARTEGEDFRFELLDALYPVLHTLATPEEMLQRASIATLNILTSSCGYATVKDLVVENVDYLTNAVALKLNAFDVSPQAPQVLLMMLRLAGPALLPYLEDTVESIFAALEDYHGYPVLAELLFKVLGVMAEEGVKTPQLALEAGNDSTRRNDLEGKWVPATTEGLAVQLRLRAQDEIQAKQLGTLEREPHPKRPWAEKADAAGGDENDAAELAGGGEDPTGDEVESAPPASRTYNLLLKITELTQHFLPSASASLRTSLLSLIRTTAPALAKHENSFLPLINALWPEVTSRLDDEEAHIVATALDIVRVLCECARDFMRTRIIQLWPRLLEIHHQTAKNLVQSETAPEHAAKQERSSKANLTVSDARIKQALARMEQVPSNYGDTSARLLWTAIQALIPAIVQHVHMSPEYVDEALAMVAPTLNQQTVRLAFEDANSDALWLALVKAGQVDRPISPEVPRSRSWSFAVVAARYNQRSH